MERRTVAGRTVWTSYNVESQGVTTSRHATDLRNRSVGEESTVKQNDIPSSIGRDGQESNLDAETRDLTRRMEDENIGRATPPITLPRRGSKERRPFQRVTNYPYLSIDSYAIPTWEEDVNQIAGGEQYSRLDLKDAYLQLPVNMNFWNQFSTSHLPTLHGRTT
ncbi:hypothetical protein ACOME3_009052 [Neoechinorhynchus agilis]